MDEIKEPITEIGDDPAEADVQETALVPVKQDWQQRHDDREAYREELRSRVRKAQPNAEYFRPAKPQPTISDDGHKRVAAYARVSTKSTEQTLSIENQTKFYTKKIEDNPNWEMDDIYADEGKSGTSLRHRDDFKRMMENAQQKKMDLILCASVSRFARNISDCLEQVALLKTMNPSHPIGVYFETENIYTLDPNSDQNLHIHALLADWESGNKSRRMILSYDQRILTGQYPVSDLLGFRHTKDGDLIIQPEEAKTVRFMFIARISGYGFEEIADILTDKKRPTLKGRTEWNPNMVRSIMSNERTWGDLEARKSIVIDYKKGIVVKNNGQRDSAYVPGHHEGIVTPTIALAAKMVSASSRALRGNIPVMRVIAEGNLKGFINLSPGWGGFSAEMLSDASLSVYDSEEQQQLYYDAGIISGDIHSNVLSMTMTGYEVPLGIFFLHRNMPSLTITEKGIRFNKACHDRLDNCADIDIFYHPHLQSIIIATAQEKSANKVRWISADGNPMQLISGKKFSEAIYDHLRWIHQYQFRFRGVSKERNGTKFIVFSLDEPQILVGKLKPDSAEANTRGAIRFIPYKDTGDKAATTNNGVAYPIEWEGKHGVSYYIRSKRDAAINQISSNDLYAPCLTVHDPTLEDLPTPEEIQDELEYLLASM
ncbi:MAG: recombinase family protein [Oscillospiraceae bacterium]|nr:recombinase family protein [Oscillospiraceae bacterium]